MKIKAQPVPKVKKTNKIEPKSTKQHSDAIPVASPNPWNGNDPEKQEHDAFIIHKLSASGRYMLLSAGTYFLAKLLFLLYNAGEITTLLIHIVD